MLIFWHVFEVSSILGEKQRTKPKNSTLLKFFASFDTHHTTRSAKIVEKLLFLHLFFRFCDSGATQNFFFILKVKPDVYFISLSGKKREILIIYESKMQKLLSVTASEGVHLERISFKCPTVVHVHMKHQKTVFQSKICHFIGIELPIFEHISRIGRFYYVKSHFSSSEKWHSTQQHPLTPLTKKFY